MGWISECQNSAGLGDGLCVLQWWRIPRKFGLASGSRFLYTLKIVLQIRFISVSLLNSERWATNFLKVDHFFHYLGVNFHS